MSNKKQTFNPKFKQWKFRPTMLCYGYLSENGIIITDNSIIDHLTFNGSYGKVIGQRMNFQTLSCFSDGESLIGYNRIAFYLAECLELLTIYSLQNEKLTTDEFWSLCINWDKNFLIDYAVYKFFKEKYWVIRTGLNFGCKYILYKNSPEICHGNAAVYIMPKSTFEKSDFETNASRAQQRLLSNVKKDLIYCYITFLKNDFNINDKECLKFIKVTMKGIKARNS
ncbi:tRNA-splicing endonuclease subunit Sen2 [Strongyloides ratti]|uniref:tRNA-intron lyase n=1 Tax=Strongyloides ratti TaxID=34506 RepID=A0A090L3L3_STRRB|nr:tRNA-splicing endonuclease subunit Sen2 [Strongyloides ratti]CEF64297.1 tRNA-splicing endonuclease subunit Sen2 [Strongyloides ratti]